LENMFLVRICDRPAFILHRFVQQLENTISLTTIGKLSGPKHNRELVIAPIISSRLGDNRKILRVETRFYKLVITWFVRSPTITGQALE